MSINNLPPDQQSLRKKKNFCITQTMISQLKVCVPEHNATQRVVTDLQTYEINQTKSHRTIK